MRSKKLELLREQEVNEIKNETKRKLHMLDDEVNNILEKLDVNLTTLITKCNFFEKSDGFECVEKDRELRILTKNKNEIKRLKEEVKNSEDKLLDSETKISKLLTDLEYEKMIQCVILWY